MLRTDVHRPTDVLVALSLGVLGGFGMALSSSALFSPRATSDVEGQLAALRQSVAELEARTDRTEKAPAAPTHWTLAPPSEPARVAEPSRAATLTPAQVEARIARDHAEARELEHEFASEPVDVEWGTWATEMLTAGLHSLEDRVEGEIASAECRSTRCLARVAFADEGAAYAAGMALAGVFLPPEMPCRTTVRYAPEPGDAVPEAVLHVLCD